MATVALALLPWAANAAGIDCRRAATPAERSICASPQLRAADAALAGHYAAVRHAVTTSLAAALRGGQLAWLTARDRDCGATTACLSQRIAERDTILTALAARTSQANPGLADLNAIWLEGAWQPARPSPAALEPASDLPEPGHVLSFKSGESCVGGACATVGLEPQSLADGPGRAALPALLGVPQTTPFYLVYQEGKAVYGLVPAPDGSLWAVSPGCTHDGASCGFVQQSWHPLQAGSKLHRQSVGLEQAGRTQAAFGRSLQDGQ